MQLNRKIIGIISVATLMFASVQIMAEGLQQGAYKGVTTFNDKIEWKSDLMLRPIEGRQGAFLALVVGQPNNKNKEKRAAFLYLVSPLEYDSYSMRPLRITNDGHLVGVQSEYPLYKLKVILFGGKKKIELTRAANNAYNQHSASKYSGLFEFDKQSESQWLEDQPGEYGGGSGGNYKEASLYFSRMDQANGESTVSFKKFSISEAVIFQDSPGIYLFKPLEDRHYGTVVQDKANYIGTFYKNCHRGGWGSGCEIEMLLFNQDGLLVRWFEKDAKSGRSQNYKRRSGNENYLFPGDQQSSYSPEPNQKNYFRKNVTGHGDSFSTHEYYGGSSVNFGIDTALMDVSRDLVGSIKSLF